MVAVEACFVGQEDGVIVRGRDRMRTYSVQREAGDGGHSEGASRGPEVVDGMSTTTDVWCGGAARGGGGCLAGDAVGSKPKGTATEPDVAGDEGGG